MSESLCQWTAPALTPPSGNYATPHTRGIIPVWDFDASANEIMYAFGKMPYAYDNGALTVNLTYVMSSDHDAETPHHVLMMAAFARIGVEVQDLDALVFEADQSLDDHVPGTCGHEKVIAIPFTNAQADDVQAGEHFVLRITRHADDAGDDATGDLELSFVEIIQ